MKKWLPNLLFSVGVLSLAAVTLSAQAERPTRSFKVEKIADGIYAVIRAEPASLWFNPNNVFIIGKRDCIVIDSNLTSEHTREVLAELRKLTDKPVKYVVNTHWHED